MKAGVRVRGCEGTQVCADGGEAVGDGVGEGVGSEGRFVVVGVQDGQCDGGGAGVTSLVHHLPSADGEGRGYQDREGVGGTMKGKGIP